MSASAIPKVKVPFKNKFSLLPTVNSGHRTNSKRSVKDLSSPVSKAENGMQLCLWNAHSLRQKTQLYRPEPSSRKPYTMSDFFDEFTKLLLTLHAGK